MLATLAVRIEQWLFEPPEDVRGRPLGILMRILRYVYALARDLVRGDLTLRAMSLVYTTLLSIVPLMALSFSVLKGLGYHRDLEPVIYGFLEPLGERAAELTGQIMAFVDNVRSGVLGSIGLVFLLYTVITMVQKVEESFNFIWRVDQPRSFGRRFSEYLSVMIVGPAVIVAALGLLATLNATDLMRQVAEIEPFGTLLATLGRLAPYILVIGVFTFLYGFVPNTQVHVRAAFIGGTAAGIGWVASGLIFTSTVASSSRYMLIYTGFAIVIIALIWLYLSWLILLLGAQLAFYVQNPQYLRPGRNDVHLSPAMRERVALSVMYLIVNDFTSGQHRWSIARLADHLQLPGAALAPVISALEKCRLLTMADDESWLPARDPSTIGLAEVLDAVRSEAGGAPLGRLRDIEPAVKAARAAEDALRSSLKNRTVRDLVDDPPLRALR
ncbi:MAG: ribonuclease BN [Proteobacteria bacterium]|nr:MAG: ribonuclease BN [Pseudomonadota bacterium]